MLILRPVELEIFEDEVVTDCEKEIEEMKFKIETLKPERVELESRLDEAKKENEQFELEQRERDNVLSALKLALGELRQNQDGKKRAVEHYKEQIKELEKKQASCEADICLEQEGLKASVFCF
jgi:chromosome segregation ATPase